MRTRASRWLCATVFVMFGLALALWMIDIHMVISEVQMTFFSDSSESSLASLYSAARSHNVRLVAVEDVLYAFMVVPSFVPSRSCPCSHCDLRLTDGHRGWGGDMARARVLVVWQAEARRPYTRNIPCWLDQ